MADSFFGFDTTLNRDEACSGALDDLDEQEYDALNDETFGDDDGINTGALDDWEAQHEQLAEIAESSKHGQTLEKSLNDLVDDDELDIPSKYNSIWNSSNDTIKSPPVQNRQSESDDSSVYSNQLKAFNGAKPGLFGLASLPRNVCTVEELEQGLINQSANSNTAKPPSVPSKNYLFPQLPNNFATPPNRLPNVPMMPMNMYMPRMPNNTVPVLPSPDYLLQLNRPPIGPRPMQNIRPKICVQFPNHQFNMMPPMRPNFPMQQGNNFRNDFPSPNFQPFSHIRGPFHHQDNSSSHNYNHRNGPNSSSGGGSRHHNQHHENKPPAQYDEYSDLMTNREKQWLINIQLLQLNTGTPYFDDYYYTVFKDRQQKLEKENRPLVSQEKNSHMKGFNNQNNRYNQSNRKDSYNERDRNHGNRNNERDNNQTQVHRVYTPLQFENSLGKLQYGSVTAPRKIIDMDVVSHEKESEQNQSFSVTNQRDVRKTKQTLLELETLFSLVLRLEDLNNPIAITNTLKLREIREKQKIQQLETATAEEKESILRELQQDTLVKIDNKDDLLTKIFSGILNEDKLNNYLMVKKGKVLLLRLMAHLSKDGCNDKLLQVWIRILKAVPVISKKDQAGDKVLLQLFNYYDQFIDLCQMDYLVDIGSALMETAFYYNSSFLNLSCSTASTKTYLNFIMHNRYGTTCIIKLVEHGNVLVKDAQIEKWRKFVEAIVAAMDDDLKQHHELSESHIENMEYLKYLAQRSCLLIN